MMVGWIRRIVVASWLLASMLMVSAARAEAPSLRLVTYNVWGVPHVAPDRVERIREIARRLSELDAHVVALQEVWLPEDAAHIGAVLKRAGLVHQHHFGPTAEHDGSGLFIASVHPLERIRFEAFSEGKKIYIPWHIDWMADKGVGVVRVATPAGPVDIANTHLQASYLTGNYRFVQMSQALQIADTLSRDAEGATRAPLILVGDLNGDPRSLPVRLLTARVGLEAASNDFDLDGVFARPGGDTQLTVSAVRSLFTEPMEVPGASRQLLSDHPCLVVDYRVQPCAGECSAPATPRKWRTVATEALASLRADAADTERLMVMGRVAGFALPGFGFWMLRRTRRRLRRHHRLAYSLLGVVLFLMGGWLGYVGWDFAPYKLTVLAQQQLGLEARL